ncbi:uncharacterized protein LOC111086406 isoform X2 [Limulus polyphemus]|uniref:Uncharacterized protein LOC111086406 isoform X2 n=1 Tax=Limulus polyphemus TaxID=6850 RepID=A0ABM1SMF7_LIMPO|nr:uncharacterized protein LOC111086406 isoform X2 [Limulus polyphemus]
MAPKCEALSDLTKHHSETAVNTCFLSVKNDKIRAFCSHSSRGRSKNIQDSHSTPRAGLPDYNIRTRRLGFKGLEEIYHIQD